MIRHVLVTALVVGCLSTQVQAAETHSHTGVQHQIRGMSPGTQGQVPREPGQSAFAAIQEIVALLDADPGTDWSRVDIPALRRHLIDMSNVTLYAAVQSEPIDNGVRFMVTGEGAVRDSIRRMVVAHARTMNGVRGFQYEAEETRDGAVLTVHAANPSDVTMLTGLGFIGVMTLGAHHQGHHLAIASGMSPH
ncbi:MAG: hypothetical protein Tsb0019_24740 [Roseibium sp.]